VGLLFAQPEKPVLSVMYLVIDQRVETLTHLCIECVVDRGDQIGFRLKHCLCCHPLHNADTGITMRRVRSSSSSRSSIRRQLYFVPFSGTSRCRLR